MEWFVEKHTPTRGLTFAVERQLYLETSAYQTIKILQTPDFGKVMLLDNVVMVTERDEFVYHEMLVHPSLFTHRNPASVLIIGGGDCGTLTQVLRYQRVKSAVMVEIDEMVTRVSKDWFPQLTSCLEDKRTTVLFEDGIEYLKRNRGAFDVILVDSTDPVGPAEGLFRKEFFQDCYNALSQGGILAVQCESPWIESLRPVISHVYCDLIELFNHVYPYTAAIQTYQAGLWLFQLAIKESSLDLQEVLAKIKATSLDFKYFNTEVMQGCFMLPQFVRNLFTE